MSLFFLLSLPLLLSSPPPLNPYPYDTSYRIDCGGQTNFTNNFNDSWLSDRFFTGGSPSLVAEPHLFLQQQEKTIRFFPISFGKKNCYILNVPNGRYHFRMFFVYDNYDGKLHSPSFDVSVEGTLVFSWRSPWKEDFSRTGAYSDLFAFVKDGEADICFYSIATDPPVIGSLEIIQVDPLSYDSSTTGDHLILINYGRLTCGSGSLGSGLTNDTDLFGRGWQTDVDFLKGNGVSIKAIATRNNIRATNQEHNYFPMHLYQTAVTVVGDGALEYELPVDAKMDYLVWFHFAEIDSSITAAGQRVIDVHINGRNVSRIDIFKQVGSFTAFNWHYVVKNLNSTTLSVKLVPVAGSPLISGLENYALVPRDLATVTEQVTAMRALKESLRVPDRMGWNGDPCAPPTWDAWEGVTCHPNKDKSALVVSQIDLGSQGLKGYISEQIGLLSNLVSLNLSYNSLHGTIPSGLGQKYLTRLILLLPLVYLYEKVTQLGILGTWFFLFTWHSRRSLSGSTKYKVTLILVLDPSLLTINVLYGICRDLSNNFLSGSIPDSLISSSLQLVLLNDNEFEGQVPYELYSIGVHGGAIDTCSKEK